jgi:uncharacterized membrane protein (UPF0127 family)
MVKGRRLRPASGIARDRTAGPEQRPAVIPLTLPSGKVLQTADGEGRGPDDGADVPPSLPLDHGMLFLFGELGKHTIWMKNCKFPIDILWLDENRRVVHLEEAVRRARPTPPRLRALREAAYVVEINAKAGEAREGAGRLRDQVHAAALEPAEQPRQLTQPSSHTGRWQCGPGAHCPA